MGIACKIVSLVRTHHLLLESPFVVCFHSTAFRLSCLTIWILTVAFFSLPCLLVPRRKVHGPEEYQGIHKDVDGSYYISTFDLQGKFH